MRATLKIAEGALLVALGGMVVGCEGKAPPEPTLATPDWIEVEHHLQVPVELLSAENSEMKGLFAKNEGTEHWSVEPVGRLWIDFFPRTSEIILPADGVKRDVVFFAVGGRAQGVYAGASCDVADIEACRLTNPFAALSILVAKPHTVEGLEIQRGTQMRLTGAPGRTEANVIDLR